MGQLELKRVRCLMFNLGGSWAGLGWAWLGPQLSNPAKSSKNKTTPSQQQPAACLVWPAGPRRGETELHSGNVVDSSAQWECCR